MSIPAHGEIRMKLKERIDRAGDMYLFGGLRIFNVVVFVRRDKQTPGEWVVSVRPFVPAGQLEDEG